jgi:RNA polymerase sigma-70 factor (ECF subfamily)
MNQRGRDSLGSEADDDAAVIGRSVQLPDWFGVIFDRHAPYIHRYLARRLGSEVADDLTSETFLIAFQGRYRYDRARPNARPWLYGIATNLIGRHRRDEARQFRTERVDDSAYETCHADRVASVVTARAARPALTAALAELASSDRDVLLLIAWEELSYDEASTALGIPIGTVRSRLSRARRKVREALGLSNPTTVEET